MERKFYILSRVLRGLILLLGFFLIFLINKDLLLWHKIVIIISSVILFIMSYYIEVIKKSDAKHYIFLTLVWLYCLGMLVYCIFIPQTYVINVVVISVVILYLLSIFIIGTYSLYKKFSLWHKGLVNSPKDYSTGSYAYSFYLRNISLLTGTYSIFICFLEL